MSYLGRKTLSKNETFSIHEVKAKVEDVEHNLSSRIKGTTYFLIVIYIIYII